MSLALQITQNKTGLFYLSVFQADGVTPQSLVGTTLWFHAALGVAFSINKSAGSGITVTNTAGGANCATLQIDPADTAALGSIGVIGMPCELTLQVGLEAYELATGILSVTTNVSTP